MTRQKSPVRLEWVDPLVCSTEYRLKIIGRLPFFKHLPEKAISQINNLFHDFDASADQRIYFEGDEAYYLYLVAMGKIKLVRNTEVGRDVLLDILHSGDYFGSLSTLGGRRYLETAIAQTDCCILRISAADFDRILSDHPDVTRKVLEAVSQRLAESQEIVKQLSTFTAEQRIASALMRLAGKLGEARASGVLIQLPFSRQDLAAMTGFTVETVSRVMSRFVEDGLVKTGRKWVTITDPKKLEELAKKGAVN
ncbi:MAG: Crp/Fnr family transcriptional regulator [Anaerolineales bacterium]